MLDVEEYDSLEIKADGSMWPELEAEYDSGPEFGTCFGFGAGAESEFDAGFGTDPGCGPEAASGLEAGDGVGAGAGGGGEEWGTQISVVSVALLVLIPTLAVPVT